MKRSFKRRMKEMDLKRHDVTITRRVDADGNPEGLSIIEQFISETFVDEVLVPGETVSQIDFAKNGKYVFREMIAGAAQVIDLCADGSGEAANYIEHTFDVDKRVFALLTGCFLTNITDIYTDLALWEDTKMQIKIALNEYFLTLLSQNNVLVTSPVALTETNVFKEVQRTKEEYRRLNGRPATQMIADYSMETLIKSQALMVPNSSQVANVEGNVDFYNGLRIRYADLKTDANPLEHKMFYLLRPEFIAFGLVDPDTNSVLPGFEEETTEGFIIRKTEEALRLKRETSVNLPFGLKILKPNYVFEYPVV